VTYSKKWQEQGDPWYAALGRFIVMFEWLCHEVKTCIVEAEGNFNHPGTQIQQLAFAQLEELPAGRLIGRFNEALTYLCANSPEELEILDSIAKRLKVLKDKRNNIVHGAWLVGFGDGDFSKASSRKFKRGENAPEFKPLELQAQDFDGLEAEARELADMIMIIGGCLGFFDPFAKYFRKEDATGRWRKKTQ
jgi:hypothetical protein